MNKPDHDPRPNASGDRQSPVVASTDADVRLDALARDTVPMPSSAAWARVWANVEAGIGTGLARTAAPRQPGVRSISSLLRLFRIWQPFAAAAACVLMIASWALFSGPQPAAAAAFRPACDNNINSVEAPDGGALLLSDGEGWVIVLTEDGGSDS